MLEKILHEALVKNNFLLTSMQEEKIINYLTLLQKWNRVHNLTAINDPTDTVYLHILDSLCVHPFLHGNRIIDVGTGAGLPGIPLAIVDEDKIFTLLDSNIKKINFLVEAQRQLHLKNIEIIHSRSENYTPEQDYDSILTRAFSSILEMITSTRHLLAPNGKFLAMKGHYPKEEIAELSPEFHVEVKKISIHGLKAERCLVAISRQSI